MSDRYIVIKPENLTLSIVNPHRNVLIHLRGLEKDAGLTPGHKIAIELAPNEARQFALALVRKADEAEAGSQSH